MTAALVPSQSAPLEKRIIASSNRAQTAAKVTKLLCRALLTEPKSQSFFKSVSTASLTTLIRSSCDSSGRLIYKIYTASYAYLLNITYVEVQQVAFAVQAQKGVSLLNIAAGTWKESFCMSFCILLMT